MVSHLFFYQLMFLGLLWLCVMLHYAWPNECTGGDQRPSKPLPPPRQRSRDPHPFPGLTRKPPCAACEHAPTPHPHAPAAPPPRLVPTRGRRRQIDTSAHFCPNPDCAYRGWVGWGNLRANGHPNGGPWRQLYCTRCEGYFQETHGTPLHGTRVAPEKLVWAGGALAEGAYRHVRVAGEQRRPTALVSLQAIIDALVAAFPHELLNLPPSPAHAIAPTPEGADRVGVLPHRRGR